MKKIYTLILLALGLTISASAQYNLVINELDYDNFLPSADSAEFIELYNSGSTATDLSNFVVVLVNGANAGAAVYNTIVMPSYQLNPNSFYVICGNGGFVPNCNQVLNAFSNIIQNGSPDALAILHLPDSAIVDALSYEGSVPGYTEGNGVPLANSDTVVNSYLGLSRFPDGADSNNDSTDFVRACITPGSSNVNTSSACAAGVANTIVNSRLVAFPNPVKSLVSLIGLPTTASEWNVSILDLTGKEVYNNNHRSQNHSIQLNLSDFENGIYILDATNAEQPSYKGKIKLIVRH